MPERSNWRNRLSEGITIVLSILVAFALDSWWDNYTVARDVEIGIRAVSEELVDVEQHLGSRIAAYNQAIEYLSQALALIESVEQNQIVRVPDKLMAGALYTPTISPPAGALSAFLDSNLLSAVANRDLRHRIGELPSQFEDGADDELSALNYVEENVRPTLERSLSGADFWRYFGRCLITGAGSVTEPLGPNPLYQFQFRRRLNCITQLHPGCR